MRSLKMLTAAVSAVIAACSLFSCSEEPTAPASAGATAETTTAPTEAEKHEPTEPPTAEQTTAASDKREEEQEDEQEQTPPLRRPTVRPSDEEEINGEVKDDQLKEPDAKKARCYDVPFLSQDEMPTGCELVSTAMLLNYYDVVIEPYELIEKGYIETAEFEKDPDDPKKLYGGDPNYSYIGDPREEKGYGCYSGAIYDGMEKLLKGNFFDVTDLTGSSLDYICEMYLDLGEPVLIWVSIDMEPLVYQKGAEWIIRDTDEEFKWLSNEHCVVLVGRDDTYYYVNDPLNGKCCPYERTLTEKRFEEMGCQAVTFKPWG